MMLLGLNQHALGDVTDSTVQAFQDVTAPYVSALTDQVKPQLTAAVQPYVIASLLLGLFGFGFGLAAFLGVRNMRKARA